MCHDYAYITDKRTFDFGNGAVPAHRHRKGGGWVADTATVDDRAYIGSLARVFDEAFVHSGAEIRNNAEVSGESVVPSGVTVCDDVKIISTTNLEYVTKNPHNKTRKEGGQLYIQAKRAVHDFGNGPVPAHQHPNGRGWVADTAHVQQTAFVSSTSTVDGYAVVEQDVTLHYGVDVKTKAVIGAGTEINGPRTIEECIARNVHIGRHTTVHDFGLGAVPAHRHPNGGGWVADTAWVHADAFVGECATVCGKAKIHPGAHIRDTAQVRTDSIIPGHFRICDDVIVEHLFCNGNAIKCVDAVRTIKKLSGKWIHKYQKFDFGDGPVLAHRHENGGGWVANTAKVDTTAYVGSSAQVFDNAVVRDKAQILDTARICGDCVIADFVIVLGNVGLSGGQFTGKQTIQTAIVSGKHMCADLRRKKDILLAALYGGSPKTINKLNTTHDFGNGPVPAYQHKNGGGWVAGTAAVHSSAYIGREAQIYDNALVGPDTFLNGKIRIYGESVVRKNTKIIGEFKTHSEVHGSWYDFVDGNGAVPAQKHKNGGGWVADTADVHWSASVHKKAKVYGFAVVEANVVVAKYCLVCSSARVPENSILPEFTIVKTPLYDFGNGLVPVHKHPNGGGLVANTAHVADSAFVGPEVQVYGNAVVYSGVNLVEKVKVFDLVIVGSNCKLSGTLQIFGNAIIPSGTTLHGDAVIDEKGIK